MLLEEFGFSQPLIDDIMDFLDLRSDSLTASTLEGVGASFGASPASVGCASDAGKAKDHVANAITDMAAGLLSFRTSLDHMHKRAIQVEETTEVDLKTQLGKAESCQAPTFATPSSCTVPGNSGQAGA